MNISICPSLGPHDHQQQCKPYFLKADVTHQYITQHNTIKGVKREYGKDHSAALFVVKSWNTRNEQIFWYLCAMSIF